MWEMFLQMGKRINALVQENLELTDTLREMDHVQSTSMSLLRRYDANLTQEVTDHIATLDRLGDAQFAADDIQACLATRRAANIKRQLLYRWSQIERGT